MEEPSSETQTSGTTNTRSTALTHQHLLRVQRTQQAPIGSNSGLFDLALWAKTSSSARTWAPRARASRAWTRCRCVDRCAKCGDCCPAALVIKTAVDTRYSRQKHRIVLFCVSPRRASEPRPRYVNQHRSNVENADDGDCHCAFMMNCDTRTQARLTRNSTSNLGDQVWPISRDSKVERISSSKMRPFLAQFKPGEADCNISLHRSQLRTELHQVIFHCQAPNLAFRMSSSTRTSPRPETSAGVSDFSCCLEGRK